MCWHKSNIEEIGPQSPLRVTLREGNEFKIKQTPIISETLYAQNPPGEITLYGGFLNEFNFIDDKYQQIDGYKRTFEIGLGVVGGGVGMFAQGYQYDNQQFKLANNGYSANQLTQMNRAHSLKMANYLKYGARFLSGGNIAYSAIQTFTGNASAGSLVYDISMLGVAAIPYAGPPLSIVGSIYKPEIMNAISRIPKAGPYPQNSYILK